MNGISILDPALLLLFAVIGATVWFVTTARRRRVSTARMAVGAIGFFSGALIGALGATHTLVVIGGAVLGQRAPIEYTFRLYSLVMLGVLLVAGGLRSLASAWKLVQGDPRAWRSAVGATATLLAINVPLMPIQGFAVGFSVFLTVNLLALLVTRNRILTASRP